MAVDTWRHNPVAVVFQADPARRRRPAGLGAVQASIDTLDDALCDQESVKEIRFAEPAVPAVPSTTGADDDEPVGGSGGPASDTQFGTIDDVLDLLQGGSGRCAG